MNENHGNGWLHDITVVEIGDRIAVGACGSLLAEAGATVVLVEPRDTAQRHVGKWPQRALFAAGKRSLEIDPHDDGDAGTLIDLIGSADIVLLSSDVDNAYPAKIKDAWNANIIVCNFTAFGNSGPLAGETYSDPMIQAVSGVAHTTGLADGPPVALRVPVMEYSTAIYGAAACVTALIVRDQCGQIQRIDMALYDCAVNSLATFLPAHFGGGSPRRVGNQHSMCAPWNAYQATDGWILICSASDPSWRNICEVMGIADRAVDQKFATLKARMDNRAEVDEIVQEWVGGRDIASCMERLLEVGVACGPILRLEANDRDINLVHRSAIQELNDPVSGGTVRIPGTILKSDVAPGRSAEIVPEPGGDRAFVETLSRQGHAAAAPIPNDGTEALPLTGVRVLEIGQYTTAPLTSRHLATLGAEVLKIEPPNGDAARQWLPHNDGQSFFFMMSNSDKKSFAINLDEPEGAAVFTSLVASADILVENLKPGSLARRGFGRDELARINPRLIYCAISGFGTDSAYGQRPAFDTVVQAMSGMMDANAFEGMPLKAGISAGDFLGGEVALFSLLAALRFRGASGKGQFLDLSMQDVAAWTTAPLWNTAATDDAEETAMIECRDGYVLLSGAGDILAEIAAAHENAGLSRDEMSAQIHQDGVRCVPVRTVSEAAEHPQTEARQLIIWRQSENGVNWPLLGSPLRLSRTQPVVAKPISPPRRIDEDTAMELGLK